MSWTFITNHGAVLALIYLVDSQAPLRRQEKPDVIEGELLNVRSLMMKNQLFLILFSIFVLAACRPQPVALDQPSILTATVEHATETPRSTPEPVTTASAEPTNEPAVEIDPYVLARQLVEQTTLPVQDSWTIIPCEGEAAFFCISDGEVILGFAELLIFPLSGYADDHLVRQTAAGLPAVTQALSYEQQAAVQEALVGLAREYLAIFSAVRAITYPNDLFTPLEFEPVQMGSLPALSFGFVHTSPDGEVLERYLNIAAFDREVIYWMGINYDPASISSFVSDNAVTEFIPIFFEITANLPIHTAPMP